MESKGLFKIGYPVRRAVRKVWDLFVHLLYERTILLLTIMFCGGVAATAWHFSRLSSKLIESAALQGTSMHAESLEELRTLYTSEVVERVRPHGIEVTHDYRTKEGAIPLPVTLSMELGKRIGERGSGMQVRLYSDYPFRFRTDGGPRDEFEKEALRLLRKQPSRPFYRFEDFQGRPSLRYAIADRMRAGCVACHNTHPQSPKTDWKVGDVRGVLEIIRPLDNAVAQSRVGLKETFSLMTIMGALGLSALTLVIGRLRRTSKELERRIGEQTATSARLATLQEINVAVASTLDLHAVLDVLLEKIDRLLPYAASTVRLLNKESGLLEPVAGRNLDVEEWKREHWVGSRGVTSLALKNKEPVMVKNVQSDPRVWDPDFFRRHGLVSYLGVPLIVKGEVLGVLSVYTREEREFGSEEVEFLSTVAGQVAMAIHNSQFHEQTEGQAAELETANRDLRRKEEIQALLKELSQDVTFLDMDTLLKKLTEKIRQVFRADVSDVRVWEKGTWRFMGVAGIELERLLRSRIERGLSEQVLENRRPFTCPDVSQLGGRPAQSRLGFRGFLGVPLFSRRGEVIGVLRAITYEPREFTQEEVDLLQQLANGAAIALENSRLLEDIKSQARELEKANKVKDEFLGFVSHELKTPVNAIVGYAEMIRDKMLGDINLEQEKTLSKVMKSSEELLSMINSLLEATKIEAGAVQMEIRELNLGNFFDELRSAYDVPLNKELTLVWDYLPDLPTLNTDSKKLKHILQNLINNAIKYTDKGSVTVSARHLPELGSVEFEVTDTGMGIPEEALPFIFEMFRQVTGSHTRSSGGVGLGLHIVKKFTELLGGKIDVRSELNKGSSFKVTIPLRQFTGHEGPPACGSSLQTDRDHA